MPSNRDSWCTPRWLAEALGEFDLDPCSNPRSHIRASFRVSLEDGGDGLCPSVYEDEPGGFRGNDGLLYYTLDTDRVFVNPPYSRNQVMKWVDNYAHTDFTFLLRWDPSTQWFRKIWHASNYIWFANRRINFEPPPGVPSSSNPYPHALFFKSAPPDTLRGLGYCYEPSISGNPR
jgi:hypothetical protein